MHDRAFELSAHGEAATLEHFEHRGVLGEDLRSELAQTRFSPDRRQAPQERPAEALPVAPGRAEVGFLVIDLTKSTSRKK